MLLVAAVVARAASAGYPKGWQTTIEAPACTVSNEIAPGVVIAYRWPGHGGMAALYVHGLTGAVTWNLDIGQHLIMHVGRDGLVREYADTSQPDTWAAIAEYRVSFDGWMEAQAKCGDDL